MFHCFQPSEHFVNGDGSLKEQCLNWPSKVSRPHDKGNWTHRKKLAKRILDSHVTWLQAVLSYSSCLRNQILSVTPFSKCPSQLRVWTRVSRHAAKIHQRKLGMQRLRCAKRAPHRRPLINNRRHMTLQLSRPLLRFFWILVDLDHRHLFKRFPKTPFTQKAADAMASCRPLTTGSWSQ